MKHNSTSSINALMLLFFLVLVIFSGVAFADDAPTTIQLNLSKPPQRVTQEEEPFLEKYNEVLSEITISEEAAEVVEHIRSAVEGVKDFTMDISITEIRGQRIESVLFHLLGSVEQKVARIEFLGPSSLRGQILVADQDKMELRMFQPISNQIAVRGLEDASKEILSALSVSDLTSFFDFSMYSVEVLEVVEEDGISKYLLQVEATDELLHVCVNSDTWIPHEIEVVEGDAIGTMSLLNVVLDPELSMDKLMNLPKVKEVRM